MPAATPPPPSGIAVPVAEVRRIEAAAMAAVPPGALMQRAAAGLAIAAASELRARCGGVSGRRVVLLVGAGDNGGDALYAGARLARRGAGVDALLLADRWHAQGGQALRAAGGRLHVVRDEDGVPAGLVHAADLLLDGVLGIGGRGGLRPPAALLAEAARDAGVPVVAVDLPSGVDADTGVVAGVAVRAARTVAFGVLKPGLLLEPGATYAGEVSVIDIGLDLRLAGDPCVVVGDAAAAAQVPRPVAADDKYRRGVVGVAAGSEHYPGAAVLSAGAARHGGAGYVRYAGPAAVEVARRWPDVVAGQVGPRDAGRVQCWVVGPGRGVDADAATAVSEALACDVPVLLDADALTLLAGRPELRAALRRREAATVLTPHAGEFARISTAVGCEVDPSADPVAAVRSLAAAVHAVVLLKGATTVVATPEGATFLVRGGPPELATAGSGDVLSGLLGSLLAHAQARCEAHGEALSDRSAAAVAAAAARLHGRAGSVAAGDGRTVAALDVLAALPEAIARTRAGGGPPARRR